LGFVSVEEDIVEVFEGGAVVVVFAKGFDIPVDPLNENDVGS
jgi:hypothetical protein